MLPGPSSPPAPPVAGPSVIPSSSESSPPTIVRSLLGPTLAGKDLANWTPSSPDEAHGAMNDVSAFCADYCPVRLACVEEKCQLYRLEARALGYTTNPATEAVGVAGQSVIGIG